MALKNKYQREKQQYSNDGGMTWFDVSPANYRRGRLIEAASDDCNTVEWREVIGSWFCVGDDTIERWVNDGTECDGYDKYNTQRKQVSVDGGSTWTDTEETRTGTLIEHNSEDCGYVGYQYRWVTVPDEYICYGTNKFTKEKEQRSSDGINWVDTGQTRQGTVIEVDSEDCGYEPSDYSMRYLTFESLEDDNEVYLSRYTYIVQTVYVSTDNGVTWVEKQAKNLNVLATLNKGEKMLIKANNAAYADSNTYSHFQVKKQYIVYGNIMSLVYGDNFIGQTQLLSSYTFRNLFGDIGLHTLISAENLILPATTLTSSCYDSMFFYQTNMITAPRTLPATTLASYCYSGMFSYCSSLTTIPSILPVTTLTEGCYGNMFSYCSSLTTAPELPATTLADYCYNSMFSGCTSLTTAPSVLPATTLTQGCYYNMFKKCSKLNYIKAMFTTTPGTSYTDNWVQNVASSGTFVKNSAATWDVTGDNGIPSGWTVVDET